MSNNPKHLLASLKLPSRYESLISAVGVDIARLVVAPEESTLGLFQEGAFHVKARGRGLFLPLSGPSGTGKTTLISNLNVWLPSEYAATARLASGEVSGDRLKQAALALVQERELAANDSRILVLNVDDRESDPPSDRELAQIKGFLRESEIGFRCVVAWPETSAVVASTMATSFNERAGKSPIGIPLTVAGPPQGSWSSIALDTLKFANGLENLQDLGVDPRAYHPNEFASIGEFLDRLESDFVRLLADLLSATRKPLEMITVFVSESPQAQILNELTGSSRYGLLDAHHLLSATPKSVIGKWWEARPGLLVQTIVRLDARVVFIGPSLSVAILRRFGPENVSGALADMGIAPKPPSDISTYLDRSDFGRLLLGTAEPTGENRGNPARDASAAFALLASDVGFNGGQDKKLNVAVADFLTQSKAQLGTVDAERKLAFADVIPDIAIDQADSVICLELHWRSGDFQVSANRSEIAQYVLGKLRSYATALGWVND